MASSVSGGCAGWLGLARGCHEQCPPPLGTPVIGGAILLGVMGSKTFIVFLTEEKTWLTRSVQTRGFDRHLI